MFWDYTWAPRKPTSMHFHDKDRVEVFVDGGTLKTITADGREEAINGSPRAIVLELKPLR